MLYVMFEFNGAEGVNVAVFVAALKAFVPATALPAGSVTTTVCPVTASLYTIETAEFTAAPVAPDAGVTDVTVGRAAVVKDHVAGDITAPPLVAVAPDTVTEYVVAGVSVALGVNVAMVPPPLRISDPEIAPAPVSWMAVVPLTTGRSNVTETVAPRATPVALAAGVRAVIDGATTVEKDHVTGVIVAPAAFVAPDAMTE
jgi:hypothetical protein